MPLAGWLWRILNSHAKSLQTQEVSEQWLPQVKIELAFLFLIAKMQER